MRRRTVHQGLTVNAIAGTFVVFFGLDLAKAKRAKFRGFAFKRFDSVTGETVWLRGMRAHQVHAGRSAERDPGGRDRARQLQQGQHRHQRREHAHHPRQQAHREHLPGRSSGSWRSRRPGPRRSGSPQFLIDHDKWMKGDFDPDDKSARFARRAHFAGPMSV
jgi:hypothetical protein